MQIKPFGWFLASFSLTLIVLGAAAGLWWVLGRDGPKDRATSAESTSQQALPAGSLAADQQPGNLEQQGSQGSSGAEASVTESQTKSESLRDAVSSSTTDTVSLEEYAEVKVERAPGVAHPSAVAAPPGGGRVEVAGVEDTVEIVIRDARGKVKERRTTGK